MTMPKLTNLFVALIALFLLLACQAGDGTRGCLTVGADCTGIGTQSGAVTEPVDSYDPAAFLCTAVPSASVVYNQEIFTLNISAAGGVAPYSVPGYSASFASTTALNGGYYNNSTTDRIVNRTVYVTDSANHTTSCNFSITVRSQAAQSPLACTISTPSESFGVGEVAVFTIDVTGVANATFDPFYLQPGWSATVSKSSPVKGTVSAIYYTPGIRSASVKVKSGGYEAICSKQVTVRQPKLDVTLIPSSSTVRINEILKVQAVATGFSPASVINYTFETSEPGITIVAAGDHADVSASDGMYHSRVPIRVKATNALGETAGPITVYARFANESFLACEIQNGAMASDGSIPFTLVPTNSSTPGDYLVIQSFNPGYGAIRTSGYTNPVSYKFSGTGYQVVSATAKSALTGMPCFNGATFSKVIKLREQLNRCDIVVNPNPSLVGDEVVAQVTTPANVGSGSYRVDLLVNGGVVRPGPSPTQPKIYFPSHGTFPITANVTDLNDGKVVSCNTTQVVNPKIITKHIVCSSSNYRYNECYAGPGHVLNAFVLEKYSAAPCHHPVLPSFYFGYSGEKIWVNYGCRAKFEVRVKVY